MYETPTHTRRQTRITTVTRQDPANKTKINTITEKLLAHPEIAKLIDELGTSTTDANDLVRGMLQAPITKGLNAKIDTHLGYQSADREAKTATGIDNYHNGTYPKTADSTYRPVTIDLPPGQNWDVYSHHDPSRLQAFNGYQ